MGRVHGAIQKKFLLKSHYTYFILNYKVYCFIFKEILILYLFIKFNIFITSFFSFFLFFSLLIHPGPFFYFSLLNMNLLLVDFSMAIPSARCRWINQREQIRFD